VVASFSRWLPGWSIVPSVCVDAQNFPDPASGGIVIAVCPKLVSFCEIEPLELMPGRCLSVSLSALVGGLQRNLQVLIVHNYGLTFSQVNDIGNHLDSVLQICHPQPCQFFPSLLAILTLQQGMTEPLRLDGQRRMRCQLLPATQVLANCNGKSISSIGAKYGNPSQPTTIRLAIAAIDSIGRFLLALRVCFLN